MSFDLFTLDIATSCPIEYARMVQTSDAAHALWVDLVDGVPGVTESDVLAAKIEADKAEAQARAAYALKR